MIGLGKAILISFFAMKQLLTSQKSESKVEDECKQKDQTSC